ncbi:hypothetical protein HYH02_014591 [Chlamydomonas schloesseri]|uniref:Methyltransferase FkbM domain-containing protein n=1 Tax=Chlamydomonas schloesseri TaxID=2026947 RepID=A0A835SVJ3_9CHLO|nr:hypothetical protein HYH02_014591 [Chlamydomonas schloesseri]|eukprot:KAG2427370.1 hypothetical protein HYH02_014591 [Chlamydomonas schloesseri]
MVEMEGCDHVIEVGGYLTPLERYLLSGGGVSRLTNIEPGYNRAPLSNVLLPGGRCVRALSLPFTLSEYLAAAEVAKGAVGRSSTVAVAAPLLYGGPGGYSSDEAVCVVALGYSVPHRDGDADYALVSDAQLVVLEASISSVHNEVALNLTVALLTQPPGAATHELVTDTRLHLRDPHAAEHRHGDNSRRRLVTMRRVRRRGEQAAAYRAAAAAATGGRRYTPALSSWEGSNGQALCATVTDFRCTGNATTGLKQPRDVSGGALCARHFYRIPGVHTFAPPFARLLPLEEFGVCSQCGQDGVIAAIFNHIGVVAPWPQRGYYVEFGARIPNLLNSAYLRKHCGWSGLLLDGAPGATEHSPCHQLNACEGMEHVKQAFITAANVNELFARHGVPARFDLLTIDVDHQDYWILKALLEAARFVPSLVVVEFNPNFANTQAVTVPRNDSAVWDGSRHYGASLAAFARLAAAHGYCYVYNLAFTHALFVRCELLHPLDRRLELPPETEARGVTLHKPDPHNRSWQEVPSP